MILKGLFLWASRQKIFDFNFKNAINNQLLDFITVFCTVSEFTKTGDWGEKQLFFIRAVDPAEK